jgi:hypothetical protein
VFGGKAFYRSLLLTYAAQEIMEVLVVYLCHSLCNDYIVLVFVELAH